MQEKNKYVQPKKIKAKNKDDVEAKTDKNS